MDSPGIILAVLLQAANPAAPPPGLPAGTGVYYLQGDAKWFKLEPPASEKSQTKGMGLFIETAGLSNLDTTIVYRGSRAALQISNPRPTFYVRGAGPAADALIVELTRKKDSRTVQTVSSEATIRNKGGFKRPDIRRVAVAVFSDASFSVKPLQDLEPGEYLLVFGYVSTGVDFGIEK